MSLLRENMFPKACIALIFLCSNFYGTRCYHHKMRSNLICMKVKISKYHSTQLKSTVVTSFDYQPLPKLSTVEAVEAYRLKVQQKDKREEDDRLSQLSLSALDLCQLTGSMDLPTAQRELSALGYLMGANLSVNDEGDIVYNFPAGRSIVNTVNERNLGMRVRTMTKEKVLPAAFGLTKVVFGAFLISSLTIAATAAMLVISSGSSSTSSTSNDRNDDRDDKQKTSNAINLNRVVMDTSFDFYRYEYYYGGRGSGVGGKSPLALISSFYSFVFGDGDPNADIGSKQMRKVLAVIRDNNGLVCAEQLAPYLNPPRINSEADSDSNIIVDESWMLEPILKLDGIPVVTPEGDIIYDFTNVNESKFATELDTSEISDPFIQESEIPFSLAHNGSVPFIPMTLGLMNVLGVGAIKYILRRGLLAAKYPAFNAFLGPAYPFLLAYSIFYMATPTIRALYLRKANAEIKERNINRQRWANILKEEDDFFLSRKLFAIKNYLTTRRNGVDRV